jgi:MraZ protein
MLDAKGRISMPAKFRGRLQESCAGQLVVTIDPCDPCLLVYPLPSWEDVETQLVAIPSANKTARDVKRVLMGHAEDCEMDAQGRILLSLTLRQYAGLEKRLVLLGQGNKFELWDEQAWLRHREQVLREGFGEGGEQLSADLQSLSY